MGAAGQVKLGRPRQGMAGSSGMQRRQIDLGGSRGHSARGWVLTVKIFLQYVDPALDPFADEVVTLGLDLLAREAGYRRGAVNPFLPGY